MGGGVTRRRFGAVAGGAGLLGACGRAGEEQQHAAPQAHVLSGKLLVTYRLDPSQAVYDATAPAFRQQHPNVQLKQGCDLGASTQTYDTPLLAILVAGTPPDAFWLRLTSFASYLSKRLLLNIEPYSRRDARVAQLEDFFPGILDQGRVRGALYGLPADGGGPVLFYNVEQFDRAGVPTPGVQQDGGKWTADAFLDAGKRLTRRSPGAEVWGAQDPLFHISVWLAWVWAWGGDFLTRDGQQVALDAAPAIDALQWQQDLITRHGVLPIGGAGAARGPRAERPAGHVPRRAPDDLGLDDDRRGGPAAGGGRAGAALGRHPAPGGEAGPVLRLLLPRAGHRRDDRCAGAGLAVGRLPDRPGRDAAAQPRRGHPAPPPLGGHQPGYLRTLPPAFARSMARVGERSRPMALIVDEQGAWRRW